MKNKRAHRPPARHRIAHSVRTTSGSKCRRTDPGRHRPEVKGKTAHPNIAQERLASYQHTDGSLFPRNVPRNSEVQRLLGHRPYFDCETGAPGHYQQRFMRRPDRCRDKLRESPIGTTIRWHSPNALGQTSKKRGALKSEHGLT